jgi:2-oxoglutarate ferredoxin oxidoreductase subunit delta
MAQQRGSVRIDDRRCKGCELCIEVCPQKVLFMSPEIGPNGHYQAYFNEKDARCTACRLCVIVCPDVAITLYKLDPTESLT